MFLENQRRAWAGIAPGTFISDLGTRETQIIALELLAICITAHWAQEELKGAAAILFVDNLSVACMIAKGCTRMPDLQPTVTALLVFLRHLQCRWWVEYVPSKANPADEPSRTARSSFAKCEKVEAPLWATPFMDLESAIKVAHPQNVDRPMINAKSKRRHLEATEPKKKRKAWLKYAKRRRK